MIDMNAIDRVIGSQAYDRDGDKIGKVNQVYLDDQSGSPLWATVHTGFFGTNETVVPLQDATWDGDKLRVGYDKATVKDAPNIETDAHISESEQDELFRYYGLSGGGTGKTGGGRTPTDQPGRTPTDQPTVGHDTSGPNTDTAMTRSEEQLHVGTEKVQSGRAKLRKHVVTEHQDVTVPVTHEEVRVEREPITDANRGKATSGPAISDEEHEVVLNAERPVVDKETVPVERVRLDKETVTENERVSGDVRKEEIDYTKD